MNTKFGFTLIELLVTLTLLAILLTLAVPAYKSLISNTHSTTQIDQLITAINFTHNEAVKRHNVITLCATSDQKTCSNNWSAGWLVFIDKHASGHLDPGDEILRIYAAIPKHHHLEWHALRNYLQMTPTGGTRHQNGHFTYYSDDKNIQQEIFVSQTGRIRIN